MHNYMYRFWGAYRYTVFGALSRHKRTLLYKSSIPEFWPCKYIYIISYSDFKKWAALWNHPENANQVDRSNVDRLDKILIFCEGEIPNMSNSCFGQFDLGKLFGDILRTPDICDTEIRHLTIRCIIWTRFWTSTCCSVTSHIWDVFQNHYFSWRTHGNRFNVCLHGTHMIHM